MISTKQKQMIDNVASEIVYVLNNKGNRPYGSELLALSKKIEKDHRASAANWMDRRFHHSFSVTTAGKYFAVKPFFDFIYDVDSVPSLATCLQLRDDRVLAAQLYANYEADIRSALLSALNSDELRWMFGDFDYVMAADMEASA